MSVSRANRPGATGQRGHSSHQNWADKVLREKGYTFLRSNSNDHNVYVNDVGQRITVSCSPRNDGNARRMTLNDIARHTKQRTAVSTTREVSRVDQYLAMADSYLTNATKTDSKREQKARYSALTSWTKRVLERHGPVHSKDLVGAAERLGYPRNLFNNARIAAGAISYNAGGSPSVWMICLEHQLPEGFNARKRISDPPMAVDPIAPEPPLPPEDQEVVERSVAALNGKPQVSDQQAAALMLLESLGMKTPGQDVKDAIKIIHAELEQAKYAIEHALKAVGDAYEVLS